MIELEKYISDELVRLKCSEYEIEELIKLIHPFLVKPKVIEMPKVVEWLNEKNLSFKSRPVLWLKKALVEELEKGTFDLKPKRCEIHSLLVVLEQRGIKAKKHADIYISTMFDYLYNNGILSQQEIIENNHKAVAYLAGKGKTTNDFIELWKKSNVCKDKNIDWAEIDRLAQEQEKWWFEIMEDLDK